MYVYIYICVYKIILCCTVRVTYQRVTQHNPCTTPAHPCTIPLHNPLAQPLGVNAYNKT